MADNVLDDAKPAPTDMPDDSPPPVESAVTAPQSDASPADAGPSARKDRSRLYVILGAIAVLVAVVAGVTFSKLSGDEKLTIEEKLAEMPGEQAPRLTSVPAGAEVASQPFDFQGFLADADTPVLVLFFANWHPTAKTALPEFQRIVDDGASSTRGLAVATLVNSAPAEAGYETPEAAAAAGGVTAPLVRDDSQADFRGWYINDLPQAYVVDPDGTVLLAKSGKKALADAEKYLAEHAD